MRDEEWIERIICMVEVAVPDAGRVNLDCSGRDPVGGC